MKFWNISYTALGTHGLRRGLEQSIRGRVLADAAAEGVAVPIYCVANFTIGTPPQPVSGFIDLNVLKVHQMLQAGSAPVQHVGIGLGRTPWSLVTQTNVTTFSYCLAPHGPGKNSALFLGASAKLAGSSKIASTPLVSISNSSNCCLNTNNDGSDPNYMVQLEGIKAGDVAILTTSSGITVLLDTFRPFSILADGAYQVLKKVVTSALGSPAAKPLKPFDLCFQQAKVSEAPDLVFTFHGGAALTVPSTKYLLDVGNGTVCMPILSSAARLMLPPELEGLTILGSLQQENIHFLFDLEKKTLSFEPADCIAITMGRLMATLLLVLCLISLTTCSLPNRAAALYMHGLRRGMEQSIRGRLLTDTAAESMAMPIKWSSLDTLYNVANLAIGTPPQSVSGILDLNGAAIWTQCSTCTSCFKQDLPLYNPSASSTYQPEPCSTALCQSIPPENRNCSGDGECRYEGPPSLFGHTFGIIISYDIVTIGTAKGRRLIFGCVTANDINITLGGSSGFIGLGRTPWSLIGQMNITVFSYCLSPHGPGKNSVLFLGTSEKLTGSKIASTPLVRTSNSSNDDGSDPYYMVQLEGIKAGDEAVATASSSITVVLDTFLSFSYLADSVYQGLKKVVTSALGSPTAKPLKSFDLCFQGAKVSDAPELVFTFQGGATLTVPSTKYLLGVGNGTVCLSILNSASWLDLTGERLLLEIKQQMNVLLLQASQDADPFKLTRQPQPRRAQDRQAHPAVAVVEQAGVRRAPDGEHVGAYHAARLAAARVRRVDAHVLAVAGGGAVAAVRRDGVAEIGAAWLRLVGVRLGRIEQRELLLEAASSPEFTLSALRPDELAGEPFDVCFPKSSAGGAPELVLTFQGGAAMRVPPASYLLDDGNGGVCLAILSSARLRLPRELEGISILGSLQQENTHLLFDLEKKTLSFEPADCSKLSSENLPAGAVPHNIQCC
uniref:Peptidase A1 domain-containing protein n=1 Tax=Leersia perrieri TaxID=77586 RepID=A0A0D9XLY0_9ORYZ